MNVTKMDGRRVLAVLSVYEEPQGRYVAEVIGVTGSTPGMVDAARWTGSDPTECVRQAAEHLCTSVAREAGQ